MNERKNSARIITGADLLKIHNQTDMNPALIDRLDPEGINVIAFEMPHRDMEEMRLEMLFKLKGKEEPTEGSITIPFELFTKIVQTITIGEHRAN